MESSERAKWVEYLLKREFGGHGWSKWLLTAPPAQFPRSSVEEKQSAKDAMLDELAGRRAELEAMPIEQLLRRGAETRIKDLEGELQTVQASVEKLEHDNAKLRATEAARNVEKPLATRTRRNLLCIIGGLAHANKIDLSEPYKACEVVAAMMPGMALSARAIGDYLKEVPDAMDSRRS